jgi:hypothetical protein
MVRLGMLKRREAIVMMGDKRRDVGDPRGGKATKMTTL